MPYVPKTDWKYNDVLSEKDMNRIEGGIAEGKQLFEAHATDKDNPHNVTTAQIGAETPAGAQAKVDLLRQKVEVDISNLKRDLNGYNAYRSASDALGQYTVVDYRRDDGTLHLKSTLSNPDAMNNYRTALWQFYNDAGTTLISTIRWTITYDSNNKIVSEVMAYE